MATRTDHELKIRADDKELKKLGHTLDKAFSPKNVKKFDVAVSSVEKTLVGLKGQQEKLNKELGKVEKGTKEYKELNKQLRGVKAEAKGAEGAIKAMQNAMKRAGVGGGAPGAPGGYGGGYGGQRGSFVAGMGQGLGISQYIPTGPGMGRRMGGAMLGGAMRRGGGAAAAPFTMPGIGGFAHALGAIPFVGQAAAGALQSAQGFYQQSVGYDQARMRNLYLAGGDFQGMAGRIGNIPGQKGLSAQADTLFPGDTRYSSFKERLGVVNPAERADVKRRWLDARTEMKKFPSDPITGKPILPKGSHVAPSLFKAASLYDEFRGQTVANVSAATEKKRAAFIAGEQAKRSGQYRAAVGLTDQIGMGEGVAYGFGPTQMQGMLGQFGQARGGAMRGAANREFRVAMAAQSMLGIGMQQSGQFARMGIAGGGGQKNMGLANVLAGAVVQGLEGSQISEYLGAMVQLGQKAEQSGVKIDMMEYTRGTGLLKGLGMQGLQGQRIAGGLNQAAMGLSERGVSSPQDMLMMRAAGWDPSQGAEGYMLAKEKLEGGMSSNVMKKYLGMLTEGSGGFGVGGASQRQFLRSALASTGVKIGSKQAGKLIRGYSDTGELDPEIMKQVQAGYGKAERGGLRGDLITAAKTRAGIGAPGAVTAAGMQVKQIAVGQKMAPLMVTLQNTSIETAKVLSNFSGGLTSAAKAVQGLVEGLNSLTKGSFWENVEKALNIDIPMVGQ